MSDNVVVMSILVATDREVVIIDIERDRLASAQGIRDRATLKVNYPMAGKKGPAGEVNPATQQIDFYIRSPQMNAKNKPNREVFLHFFGMEVTWK